MSAPEHGTVPRYSQGCRCHGCIVAGRRYNAEKQSERALRISEIPHGTYAGYASYMCRCRKCAEANRDYRRKRLAAMCPDKHGTTTGYAYGCRCDKCGTAHTLRNRPKTSKAVS
jgi:hypothetical protein